MKNYRSRERIRTVNDRMNEKSKGKKNERKFRIKIFLNTDSIVSLRCELNRLTKQQNKEKIPHFRCIILAIRLISTHTHRVQTKIRKVLTNEIDSNRNLHFRNCIFWAFARMSYRYHRHRHRHCNIHHHHRRNYHRRSNPFLLVCSFRCNSCVLFYFSSLRLH